MWVARNRQTHELVAVTDHDPFTPRYDSGGKVLLETPLSEQIDAETEEIVELPGEADVLHAAIDAAGEVTSVKVPDSGRPEITPRTGRQPVPFEVALEQVAAERAWLSTRQVTVADIRRILDRTQGRA